MNSAIRKSRPRRPQPVAQRGRRVTDHKINRLLFFFFFLTYRGSAQTELLPRDSSKAITTRDGGGRREERGRGDARAAGWRDEFRTVS